MFGKNKTNFTPEITTNIFTKTSELPVVPLSTIAEFAYGKRGLKMFSVPGADEFMMNISKGYYGEIVGIWLSPQDPSNLFMLNRKGQLVDSFTFTNYPADKLKTNAKNGGGEAEKCALIVGPSTPLAKILITL